jgi:hypothetical protein
VDSGVFEVGGNVGIGTTTPAGKLDLSGPATDFNVTFTSAGGYGRFRFVQGASQAATVQAIGSTFGTTTRRGDLELSAEAGDVTLQATNGRRVGIGTVTPSETLHVIGNALITGNITVDGNIAAKYQDVAEWVDSAEPLEAGSVVIVDELATNRVTASAQAYDSRVVGAVSPQPGLVLGEPGPGRVLVAQSGRVRVKVDTTYGAIRPGDLIVASPTRGHGMRSEPVDVGGHMVHRPGTIIGKALEGLSEGRGDVLVLLTLQ